MVLTIFIGKLQHEEQASMDGKGGEGNRNKAVEVRYLQ